MEDGGLMSEIKLEAEDEPLLELSIDTVPFVHKTEPEEHEDDLASDISNAEEIPYDASEDETNVGEVSAEKQSEDEGLLYECQFCLKPFSDYNDLNVHLIRGYKCINYGVYLMPKDSFNCDICNEKFTLFFMLIKHKKVLHKVDKPYECLKCEKYFTSLLSARHHVRFSHLKPLQCPMCSKSYRIKSQLESHLKYHQDPQVYKCEICTKTFVSESSLIGHRERHFRAKDDVFLCETCGKVFTSYPSLYSHVRMHSSGNFVCNYCGKLLSSESTLANHVANIHADDSDKIYKCGACDKLFATRETARNHTYSHRRNEKKKLMRKNKSFSCDICHRKFMTAAEVARHVRRIHKKERNVQCKHCDKLCFDKRSIEQHMRVHTNEKPYICSFCGKSFSCTANLHKHKKRIHLKKNK